MGLTVRAWRFRSQLSLSAMLSRINASVPEAWDAGDSDYKDYIGGRLTRHCVGRIYDARSHYVAEVKHFADHITLPWRVAAGELKLKRDILPLVEAQAVESSAPFD